MGKLRQAGPVVTCPWERQDPAPGLAWPGLGFLGEPLIGVPRPGSPWRHLRGRSRDLPACPGGVRLRGSPPDVDVNNSVRAPAELGCLHSRGRLPASGGGAGGAGIWGSAWGDHPQRLPLLVGDSPLAPEAIGSQASRLGGAPPISSPPQGRETEAAGGSGFPPAGVGGLEGR